MSNSLGLVSYEACSILLSLSLQKQAVNSHSLWPHTPLDNEVTAGIDGTLAQFRQFGRSLAMKHTVGTAQHHRNSTNRNVAPHDPTKTS